MSAAIIRFVVVMSALLVVAVRVFVVSALLVTAVVRFIMLVPSVVSASGKLGTSEVAVVGEGHGAEESEEGEEKESSEVYGWRKS